MYFFFKNEMIRHSSDVCMELSLTDERDIRMATCDSSNVVIFLHTGV
jgi:hypothetical protein